MHAIKSDGFAPAGTNVANNAQQIASLWCTEAVTEGQWIAEFSTDTTNPAGQTGDSYRIAVGTNADALYNTVGVAAATTTAAGYVPVYVRGRVSYAGVDDDAFVAIGDDLIISSALAGQAIEWSDGNTNVRLLGRCLSTPTTTGGFENCAVELYVHPKFAE